MFRTVTNATGPAAVPRGPEPIAVGLQLAIGGESCESAVVA
jgi:hypothetical protein